MSVMLSDRLVFVSRVSGKHSSMSLCVAVAKGVASQCTWRQAARLVEVCVVCFMSQLWKLVVSRHGESMAASETRISCMSGCSSGFKMRLRRRVERE